MCFRFSFGHLLVFALLVSLADAAFSEDLTARVPIECEGDYRHHLQGVATDGEGAIFWSFTTMIVRTDAKGKVLVSVEADNHQGDLCYHDGKVYVAVNLGRFNDPAGNADSWIYVYDPKTLKLLEKHPVPEVFHGAGGMDVRDGHFFVVGGLPDGVGGNYVYEYDARFRFVKKHVIASGWTQLGIQTAAWHDGVWWFGCYGSPAILLKTDADFQMLGRHEFNCSLGVVGVAPGKLLVAEGPRTTADRHRGILKLALPATDRGLVKVGD